MAQDAPAMAQELKKPLPAYWLWVGANRERIVAMVGSKNGPIVSKKASELWKAAGADEKAPFEEEAQRQRDAYYLAKGTQPPPPRPPRPPRKPRGTVEKDKARSQPTAKARSQPTAKASRQPTVKAVVAKDDKFRLKRPLSGYIMWLNENRERIRASLGKGGPAELKQASVEWKAMTEEARRPYEDRARKAKEEYKAKIQGKAVAADKPTVLDGDAQEEEDALELQRKRMRVD